MCPPADKKAKLEEVTDGKPRTAGVNLPVLSLQKLHVIEGLQIRNPALLSPVSCSPTQSSAVPTDALSALGSLLPKDAPKPELPEVRPEDIVLVGALAAESVVLLFCLG